MILYRVVDWKVVRIDYVRKVVYLTNQDSEQVEAEIVRPGQVHIGDAYVTLEPFEASAPVPLESDV